MMGDPGKATDRTKIFSAAVLAILASSAALADESGAAGSSSSSSSASSSASTFAAAPGAAIQGAALPAALGGASGPAPSGGIPVGGWMLYPSIFIGAIYNDNVYQTSTNRTAAVGVRLTPNIEADLDNGLHKTTVYFNADAQLYPGYNSSLGESASTVSGRVGLAHIWSPTSDVVVRFNADFTRQDGPFGSSLISGSPIGSATSFIGAPVAVNVSPFRQFTDQTTVNLSVEKNLTDQTYVRAGLGAQQVTYETPPTGYYSAQNGMDYSAFIRGGYRLTPQLSVFVETDGDLRRYNSYSYYDANTYRVIGGLASDLIGLFRGEIYGGVQQQFSTHGAFGALTAPAFGGRITYYPTQYLTVAISVDNGFGAAGPAPIGPLGVASSLVSANTQTLQARLQADYALFESWKASARAGYAETRYYGSNDFNQAWLGGLGLSYSIWRNFALTLDYQYTQSSSNGYGALSYTDNLISAGATYRY